MDFVKDILSALAKIVEPVFINSRACYITFVGLTLLLRLPTRWLVPVGLDVIQVEYKSVIGILWAIFGAASVWHLAEFIEIKRQESKGSSKKRARMRKRLHRLTEGQKDVLRQFMANDGLSIRLRVDKDVHELEDADVLSGPMAAYGPRYLDEEGLFWIDPWAMKYLRDHPKLWK